MGMTDYIILSIIVLVSFYILYRAFFKKDKCADCSQSSSCSSIGSEDFEKVLRKKLSDDKN